ncbi:MAG: hypothetical protein H5T80_12045 [Dietzia sp.]|nr:hypothetical protein [Dietzia sp.]
MALESLAENLEKTRFELMRGQRWTDLRASERETRVDLARRALEESGMQAELDQLRRQADRVPELEALVARQRADLASLEARLEADRVAHEAQVTDLDGQLADARRERDRAVARVVATEAVVEGVRALVTAPIEVPADDEPSPFEPVGVAVPTPATDGSAHQRRPLFKMARSAPAT